MSFSASDWRNRIGSTSGSYHNTPYTFSGLEQSLRQGRYYWNNSFDGASYGVYYERCGGGYYGYNALIVEGLALSTTLDIKNFYRTYYTTEFGYSYSYEADNYAFSYNVGVYQPQNYYGVAVEYYNQYNSTYSYFNYGFPYSYYNQYTNYHVGNAYIYSPYVHGFYWYGALGTYSNVPLYGQGNYQFQQTYINGWCS